MKNQRSEYPRPQFQRDDWMTLNGEWEFAFDDDNAGIRKDYTSGNVDLDKKIIVPFSYQYEASGLGDKSHHETVWYRRTFTIAQTALGRNALLCFNACDYKADVWINGKHVTCHVGGFAPFSVDITPYLDKSGKNVIVVRCIDPMDPNIPRGKQSWKEPFGCWYVPNTGIWQSVWIEFFDKDGIDKFALTPDIDENAIFGEITTLYGIADEAEFSIKYGDAKKIVRFGLDGKHTRYSVNLMTIDFVDEKHYWTPEQPNLFGLDITLFAAGNPIDVMHTRFGMRKISVDPNGIICLNNRPLYQRLILDQGYWRQSGLTPPSTDDIRNDILLSKKMGFNGARKHQKLEDPYFYYFADELGFLVWCEMPSVYNFNVDTVYAQSTEWQEIISAVRNFSSIVCYVPLNESWGVRKILTDKNQQNYARAMYYITKSIDGSRLVSSNDGWEQVDATDIMAIHDYSYDSSEFKAKYAADKFDALYPQNRKLIAYGNKYADQPALLTEFGGIAMKENYKDGSWGYNSGAATKTEFYARLQNLMTGVYDCDFGGYCYTQLTDVQQEVNGLLDADHKPKFDIDTLKKLFDR